MNSTSWTIFSYTHEGWNQMLQDCENAKKSILFEQFLFDDIEEGIGKMFLDIFEKKQKEGVQLYLIFDLYGSFSLYFSERIKTLQQFGAKIVLHAITPNWNTDTSHALLRDHRKIMIVDSDIAYVGGVVVVNRAIKWRDAHVRFQGHVVADIEQEFWCTWREGKDKSIPSCVKKQHDKNFHVIVQDYLMQRKEISITFLKRIFLAKESIKIITPYFSPPKQMWAALMDAKQRGVEISLVIPEQSEHYHADMVARYYIDKLIEGNCYVFLYPDNLIHSKIFIVDDKYASVGSCNFDVMSFDLNHELNVISDYTPFVQDILQEFYQSVQNCRVMTKTEWNKRLWQDKVWSSLFNKVFKNMV